MSENRKMRGRVEPELLQLGRKNAGNGVEVFIAKLGFVQGREAKFKTWVVGSLLKAIRVDRVVEVLVRTALERGAESDI